jgi:hypothetical protein
MIIVRGLEGGGSDSVVAQLLGCLPDTPQSGGFASSLVVGHGCSCDGCGGGEMVCSGLRWVVSDGLRARAPKIECPWSWSKVNNSATSWQGGLWRLAAPQ